MTFGSNVYCLPRENFQKFFSEDNATLYSLKTQIIIFISLELLLLESLYKLEWCIWWLAGVSSGWTPRTPTWMTRHGPRGGPVTWSVPDTPYHPTPPVPTTSVDKPAVTWCGSTSSPTHTAVCSPTPLTTALQDYAYGTEVRLGVQLSSSTTIKCIAKLVRNLLNDHWKQQTLFTAV